MIHKKRKYGILKKLTYNKKREKGLKEFKMATIKDMEDSLKAFIIQEQSDAHNKGSINQGKYNNIKIIMNPQKNPTPHVTIRITISEATWLLSNFTKTNGGLGYEERLVIKWFGKYGVKEKLADLWDNTEKTKEDK
ncbi:hypothetical protein J6R97_07870 [bacterium]|jgi:hypothetical protein|nr:hypothetical protein [bacterium]